MTDQNGNEIPMLAVVICGNCEKYLGQVGKVTGPCKFCGAKGPKYRVNLEGDWGHNYVYHCKKCGITMHFPKRPRFKRCPNCLKRGAIVPED